MIFEGDIIWSHLPISAWGWASRKIQLNDLWMDAFRTWVNHGTCQFLEFKSQLCNNWYWKQMFWWNTKKWGFTSLSGRWRREGGRESLFGLHFLGKVAKGFLISLGTSQLNKPPPKPWKDCLLFILPLLWLPWTSEVGIVLPNKIFKNKQMACSNNFVWRILFKTLPMEILTRSPPIFLQLELLYMSHYSNFLWSINNHLDWFGRIGPSEAEWDRIG